MKKTAAILIAFLTLSPAFAGVEQDIHVLLDAEPAIPQALWPQIDAQQIVITDNTFGLPGGKAFAYVPLPPEQIFAVITNYGRYMEFMPGIVQLEIKRADGAESQVYAEYASQWPMQNVQIESINIADPARHRMAWKAVHTNFKTAQGAWVIKPYKEGSLIIYQMGFDMNWVPQSLARSSGKKRVTQIFTAVIERAKQSPALAK